MTLLEMLITTMKMMMMMMSTMTVLTLYLTPRHKVHFINIMRSNRFRHIQIYVLTMYFRSQSLFKMLMRLLLGGLFTVCMVWAAKDPTVCTTITPPPGIGKLFGMLPEG